MFFFCSFQKMDGEKCAALNPSSIIDLKAELQKKYDSFRQAKLSQNAKSTKLTPLKTKADVPKDKKKPKASTPVENEKLSTEEIALQKSRSALEAKAKLYEKIVSSNILIDDEQNDSYLVDFQRKVLYGQPEPSRSARQKTPEPSNSDNMTSVDDKYENIIDSKNTFAESMQKKIPAEVNPEHPVHYQSVRHNEIRDLGTGYFAFSTDESKRKEQMEELNQMRKQTEEKRASNKRLQEKRSAMLQARLAKICERKNIDKSVLEAYKSPAAEEPEVQSVAVDPATIPLPEPETKEPKIRPWDIGKDQMQFFVPEKKKFKSQNEWKQERREERYSEFAPPQTYR